MFQQFNMNTWFNSKTAKPPNGKSVLGIVPNRRFVVVKFSHTNFYDEYQLIRDITHWTELPDEPFTLKGCQQ